VEELSLAVELSADSGDDVSDDVINVRSRDLLPGNNIQLVLTSADDDSDDGQSYRRVAVICMHNFFVGKSAATPTA